MGRKRTYKLIESKNVFRISLIVAALTILAVYFFGLGRHNTFFENSVISTTILSIAFFLFITIGLYRGVKLKDNLGRIVDQYQVTATPDLLSYTPTPTDVDIDADDGCVTVIAAILLWIVMAVGFAIALWIFSNVLLLVVLAFAAMLYWIFFRALRLVFKNSNRSKGNWIESLKWGFTYTILYNFWIYGIFIMTKYLKG
jgi:hypothetical protein